MKFLNKDYVIDDIKKVYSFPSINYEDIYRVEIYAIVKNVKTGNKEKACIEIKRGGFMEMYFKTDEAWDLMDFK